MVGIILAAGDGVRLRKSSGRDCCKSLEKVHSTRLIEYALDNLDMLGIEKAVIVIGKQGDSVKSAVGQKHKNVEIEYVHQPKQFGLINAFVQALHSVQNESAVLQLADEIFSELDINAINQHIKAEQFDFSCGITYESNPQKIKANFSVETDHGSLIKKCTEKPTEIINNIKGTGFCIFKNETLEILKNIYNEEENTPKDLCDFFNYLIKSGKKGAAFCVAKNEFNINTIADLEEAECFFN